MQRNIIELRDRLLQALDSDNNVVNMELAMEVISLLEATHITREALEATRLGRHINELRKKTTNENLARRAKDLIKRWRDMFARAANENGLKTIPSSPMLQRPPPDTVVSVVLSPALRRPASSPALGNKFVVSPPSDSFGSSASISPGLTISGQSSRAATPNLTTSVVASKSLSPGPGRPPPSFLSVSKLDANLNTVSVLSYAPPKSASGAVKRPRKAEENDETPLSKRIKVLSPKTNGDSASNELERKPVSRLLDLERKPRTSKVKTTQQLIDEMALRTGSPGLVFAREPSPSIIVVDDEPELKPPILGLLPPEPMTRVKTEEAPAPKRETLEDILAKLPPIDYSVLEEEEPEETPEKRPVDDSDVERYQSEQVENVNGNRDFQNQFHEWQETLSVESLNGELIHLLPYVIVD